MILSQIHVAAGVTGFEPNVSHFRVVYSLRVCLHQAGDNWLNLEHKNMVDPLPPFFLIIQRSM